MRPIVLRDDIEITLKVESRVPQYSLSLDSRLYHMKNDDVITVKNRLPTDLNAPKRLELFQNFKAEIAVGQRQKKLVLIA